MKSSNTSETHFDTIQEESSRELLSCGRCGTIYVSRSQLEHHLATDCGKIKNYVCHCGSRYLTEASLNQHKISHDGSKKFLCDFCGKSFLSKGQLKIHERTHTNDKPFGCGICNKRFAYRESLITHSSIHTGIKPYECQLCKKTFSCIGNLLKHRRTRPDTCGLEKYSEVKKIAPRPMTKNLPIPTIIERKSTKNDKKLRNSKQKTMETSSNDEISSETITLMSTALMSFVEGDDPDEQITFIVTDNYDTNDEDAIIVQNDDVSMVNEAENDVKSEISSYVSVEESSFACQLCPKIYKSSKIMINHLRKEHNIHLKDTVLQKIQHSIKPVTQNIPENTPKDPKSHICSKCKRSFSSRTILTDHERSNCGTKPVYVCDICNKGYHSAGSLKTHKTVHTGELKFVCQYCGQTFRTAGQVKIHARKHTGEKPYKCDKCEKSFGHRESLLTHESVHTGVKRFMCKCGQRFSCISNLKAHRRSHKDKCGKFPLVTKPVVTIEGVSPRNLNK
ncbi:zinc finger protein 883-like [Culicoides brevitarsis]|uniref:zinc finger protein 883-like n=1 Tax=Culicoides brevitarsis TaxID=469753 RepID=UPI00307C3140